MGVVSAFFSSLSLLFLLVMVVVVVEWDEGKYWAQG